MYGVSLVLLLVVLGGAIAYIGDNIGRRVGRKRLTLFGLRPKYTSIIITIITGTAVVATTMVTLLFVSDSFKEMLLTFDSVKGELSSTIGQLTKTQDAYDKARIDLSAAEQQVKEWGDKVANLQSQVDELNAQIDVKQNDIENLSAKVAEKQKALDTAQKELEKAQSQLKTAQTQLSEAVDNYNKTNDALQKTKSDLQSTAEEKQKAEDELRSTQEQLKAAREQLDISSEQLKQAESDLERARGELEGVRGELDQAQKEKELAQKQRNDLEKERDQIAKERDSLAQERDTLEEAVKSLQSKVSDLNATVSGLSTEVQDLSKTKAGLEADIGELQEEYDRLQSYAESYATGFRTARVLLQVGTIVSNEVIQGGSPTQFDAFLKGLNSWAAGRFGRVDASGNAIEAWDAAGLAAVRRQIASVSDKFVVRAVLSENYYDDPVISPRLQVEIRAYQRKRIADKGQVIDSASVDVEGEKLSRADIVTIINDLGQEAARRLIDQGMIMNLSDGSVGQVTGDTQKLLDSLMASDGPMVVYIQVAEDTYNTDGPVKWAFGLMTQSEWDRYQKEVGNL